MAVSSCMCFGLHRRLLLPTYLLSYRLFHPQEVLSPSLFPPVYILYPIGGSFSIVISSCIYSLFHRRSFRPTCFLSYRLFHPQEVLSPNSSPLIQAFPPTGGSFSQIASSCADFPIFRRLLPEKNSSIFDKN